MLHALLKKRVIYSLSKQIPRDFLIFPAQCYIYYIIFISLKYTEYVKYVKYM